MGLEKRPPLELVAGEVSRIEKDTRPIVALALFCFPVLALLLLTCASPSMHFDHRSRLISLQLCSDRID